MASPYAVGGYGPDMQVVTRSLRGIALSASVLLVALAALVVGTVPALGQASVPNGGWDGRWSPDGTQIAFVSQCAGEPPNLWVVRAGGGHARRLTSLGARSFVWASDSTALLTQSWQNGRRRWLRVPISGRPAADAWPWLPAGAAEPVASPDGAYLAYVQRSGMWQDMWVARSNGADRVRVTTKLYTESPLWSPDGHRLAFQAANPHIEWQTRAWIYDREKKTSVHMKGLGTTVHAWSPDGTKLAFSMAKPPKGFVLGVCDVATSVAVPVEKLVHTGQGVEWSRDGKSLAVTVSQGIGSVVSFVRPNGTVISRIGDAKVLARFPSLSPDGKRVVFEGQAAGKSFGSEVWVADADGGGMERLVPSLSADWAPAPSPDGRRVAFLSTRTGRCRLWIAEGSGASPRALGDADPGARLLWSPDSTQLLVFQRVQSTLYPFTAKAAGRPLPINPSIPYAAWSGDSRRLVYTGMNQHRPSLLVYDLAKNIARSFMNVAADKTAADAFGSWSPNMRRFAFVRGRDLWLADGAGGGARKLSRLTGNNDPELCDVRWSPRGDRILVTMLNVSPAGSWFEARLIGVDGKSKIILSEPVKSDFASQRIAYTNPPLWLSDNAILLSSDMAGTPQLWRLSPNGGKPVAALSRTAAFPAVMRDGSLLFVAPVAGRPTIYTTDPAGRNPRPFLKAK